MPTLTITLPRLHSGGQVEVVESRARWRLISAGRRWGKTRVGAAECTKVGLSGQRAWWVAPTYPIASIAWRVLKHLAGQIPMVEIREVDRMISFPGGGWVQVRSADSPVGLRGEGLDLVVVDEAAHIRRWDEVWEQSLRPGLSDRQGRALFISTPKGFNHFYELFRQAETSPDGTSQTGRDWQAWTFPSWTNPHLAPEEIEAARQQLPALVFRQEYGAEFVQLEGAMFRREWLRVIDRAPEDMREVRFWDLAASTSTSADYTVGARVGLHDDTLIVSDVVRGRWEWPVALRIIGDTARSDGTAVAQGIEDVGVQKGMTQMLLREPTLAGLSIRPIPIHKDKLIRSGPWLARAEQGKVAIVRGAWNAAWLDEVCAFPEASHDDQVDAVSGAVQMLAGLRPAKVRRMG
jgi:predicted phage terminase large subunit-like protein